ncbi:hypothetical protein EIP86_009947 [Pleurotus ostreatoroseus]|nr:hypothetical protein EIP86_009947 [Pleurotus ostreatoroseus]
MPSTSPGSSSSEECERLRAENASLKSCCEVWRKRAGVHAAATLGLVGLARLARDHALKMKQEKTELEEKYNALKRKHEYSEKPAPYLPTPPETYEIPRIVRSHPRATSPSTFRPISPCPSDASYCSDCPDCQPAAKRQRTSSPIPHFKRSPTTPTIPLPASPSSTGPLTPPAEVKLAA